MKESVVEDHQKGKRTISSSLGKVKIKRDVENKTPLLVFLVKYLLGRLGRKMNVQTYRFVEYFEGFDQVNVVRKIFGNETEKILNETKVEFVSRMGYMGVSDIDGHIIVSADYLKHGDLRHIYLDIIHELVHVKQFMKGKKLFDRRFSYAERVTEIEAYRYAVEEARNIGMNDEEIFQYLKTEWISRESHRTLAENLNVKVGE